MATSVADLAVNISTNIASLETGMAKAGDAVNRASGQMALSIGTFNSAIESAIGSVTRLAGVTGIGLGVAAFAGMIGSAIAGQAELTKLAERTGSTVEALSAMKLAAKLAGVSMDEVASGLQKFAKNVVAAQEGTGKQAAALQALGFNAKTFASQFATTDQAILAVAQRLNTYQDGLAKTAIEQTLLGKSGANLAVFLRELGERGLDNVKVTKEQAAAAKQLEDSLIKLKGSFLAIINAIASTLVPVLQKMVDSMGTFKNIAIAAIAAFVVWPATISLVATAFLAYRDAVIGAALATELLGIRISTLGLLLGGIVLPAQLAAGGLLALKAAGSLLFAAFAGWEIGKFLSENFLEARLAGIAFVDGMLTIWENIKYAALVAWEGINYGIRTGFGEAMTFIKVQWGEFLALLAQGFSLIPGASAMSESLAKFAQTLASTTDPALDAHNKRLAQLSAANDSAKSSIHRITDEMVDYELSIKKVAAASAKKPPPPVPEAGVKTITDFTKALDEYQKALAAVQRASSETLAKQQTEAVSIGQDQVKRLYERGVIDFQQFWDAKTALQRTALGVQEQLLQENIDEQQRLVEGLQASVNSLDPSKFKTTAEYIKAVYGESAKLLTAFAGLTKAQGDLNVVQQKGEEIGKGYIEALIAESNGHLKSIRSLDDEIQRRMDENDAIGLTQSQIIELNIARVEELRANADLSGAGGSALLQFYDDQIDRLRKLADATSVGENKAKLVAGWQELFRGAADAGGRFLADFVQHGSSAFKNLWNDFKTWALEAIAKIAAQQIVIQIAGSIGLGGLASNALANPLADVLGGGSGGLSGIGGIISKLFGDLPGFGTALQNVSTGFSTFTTLLSGGTGVFDALSLASSGLGASFTSLLGPIGLVAGLAIPLLGQLFKGSPSQVKGQFGISSGTTGFEDNAFTPSKFGNLGFLDAATQQFSGEAAQAFNKIVSGALDAFAGRMSQEQQSRLADILQKTTFASESGTFTTEDFLQKYGGQVLQQVVQAAFDVLNPAFGSVIANFQGTADEVAKFGNTLLGINDIIAPLGDDFKATIAAALADATQATADKILVFVGILSQFGDVIAGLGPKLQALDAGSITAFVDALGGAAKAAASFSYLVQNFTTGADKLKLASDELNADFTKLGVSAIPKTHAAFLALLNSFDLTTASGRELYASVLDLSSLFVAVHGTADQAANSLDGVSTALSNIAQSAQTFFQANFYSAAEQQAKKAADELKQIGDAAAALGVSIPINVAGFRNLIEGIDRSTDAGNALYASLIVLAPAIFDLSGAAASVVSNVNAATSALNNQSAAINAQLFQDSLSQIGSNVTDLAKNLDTIAGSMPGDTGDKLALKLGIIAGALAGAEKKLADNQQFNPDLPHIGDTHFNDQFYILAKLNVDTLQAQNDVVAAQLAHFVTLKAQYGAAMADQLIALESWYKGLRGALVAFPEAQSSLDQIYLQKQNEIITGTTAVIASFDEFIKKMHQLADATGGNAGQQAGIELALSNAKLKDIWAQFAVMPTWDLANQSLKLQALNEGFALQIAHFTTYTAQYGAKAADQLVVLENWYADQQIALAGNTDALAILGQIFDDKWKVIIDGISNGVDGSLSQLDKLRQGIAGYLQSLTVGNLSPLTPMEKLAQSQTAYQDELAKAQGGDQGALADVTKFADTYLTLARDAYASSQAYTDIFTNITTSLADLAGTDVTGLHQVTSDPFPALATALPTNGGTLASSEDLKQQGEKLAAAFIESLTALSNADSANTEAMKAEIVSLKVAIVDAINSGLK